jgi:hypothetical protein
MQVKNAKSAAEFRPSADEIEQYRYILMPLRFCPLLRPRHPQAQFATPPTIWLRVVLLAGATKNPKACMCEQFCYGGLRVGPLP